MRSTFVGTIAAVMLHASTIQAQPRPPVRPILVEEMPHVEMSVGLAFVSRGVGPDGEDVMRGLGFDIERRDHGSQTEFDPYLQGHVALSQHITLGLLLAETDVHTQGVRTNQSATTSTYLESIQIVTTKAVLLSFRPNAWIKVGAGPALHEASLSFGTRQGTRLEEHREESLGWVVNAEAKLRRGTATYEHPPYYLHLIGQYHSVSPLRSEATSVPLGRSGGVSLGEVSWPATKLGFTHWMVGGGIGFEF